MTNADPSAGDGAAEPRRRLPVLDVPIDVVSSEGAVRQIADWSQRRESRVVCICNAHSVVTASRDATLKRAITQADLATADGAPVAWMLRRQGATEQARVSGPDLMIVCCEEAARIGVPIFLLGSTPQTLDTLRERLSTRWPSLKIAGSLSPPFRPLSAAEDIAVVERINASGAGIVWVSLGCPKQEHWMAAHRGSVRGVMVGVGAAFDFHAGTVSRAPGWMRSAGLEWAHRLMQEPRRLWRRYLITNTAFIVGALAQLARRARRARH